MGRRSRWTGLEVAERCAVAVLVAALGVALGGCGSGADAELAAAAPEPGALATSSPPAQAPTSAATPPAEPPDPCALLTPEQAATVGGRAPLTPAPTDGQSYPKACAWSDSPGSRTVVLQVGLLYPTSPEDLPTWQRQFLDFETGTPVPGVGDGAETYSSSPATIVGVAGYVTYRLAAYNGDPSVATLLPQAASQVVAAVTAG